MTTETLPSPVMGVPDPAQNREAVLLSTAEQRSLALRLSLSLAAAGCLIVWGGLQVLVNNAGVLTYAPVLDITTEQCAQMFATNVVAAFDLTRTMAAHMVKRGSGHLVFITSGAARSVAAHGVVYAATKHAVSAFAKGFRLELKSANVRVTEIAPGMVETEMRKGITHPDVLKALAARPFKPISAQDVADGVVYAVSCQPSNSPDLIELRPPRA